MEIKPSGASLPLALLAFSLTFTSQISLAQRQSSALDQQQQPQQPAIYQPALIGFRCESAHSTTSSGVSLVEANKPVRLTLFGQYFTTSTIVALTSELVQDPAAGQQPDDEDDDQSDNADDHVQRIVRQNKSSSSSTSTASNQPNGTAPSGQPAAAAHHRRQFAGRNRVLSSKYDCTDYNRITSYKLTSANILSPNVATITISLPELEPAAASGGAADSTRNYYFCLKQPPLPALEANQILRQQQQQQQQLTSAGANATSNITSTSSLQMAPLSQAGQRHQEAQLVWVHQGDDWWLAIRAEPPILTIANDVFLILLLLFLSAVTSGLNLGLMSLDMNELAVISSCGDPRERSYARTIAPLRKRGNYLLCSLLLGNVLVNSTLTVVLEELTTGLIAVIGSTLAIVVLGEIVPQAFCARQGLAIGAKTIYLTYAFMILTFPLSYPISWLLDCVLGEEKGNVYDRERLMEFIRITGHHTQLESDEVAIISGALKLKKIKVDQIMTRIEDVFSLPINCMLDRDTIKRIIEKGYSRIPVYEFGDRKQIVALILAKDLALYDPDDKMPLAAMLKYCKHPLIFIDDSATLDVALNEFKTGKSHMAVVRQIYDDGEVDKYYEAIGVVTLEDVIEEVLQTEINDETDTLSDNRRKRRRANAQVPALEHWPVVESGASAAPPAPDQQAGELMASNLLMSQLVAADVGPRKQQAADEQNSGNSFNQTPASGANNLGGNQQLQLQLQLQQQQQRNLEQAPPSLLDESKETTANEQLARLP